MDDCLRCMDIWVIGVLQLPSISSPGTRCASVGRCSRWRHWQGWEGWASSTRKNSSRAVSTLVCLSGSLVQTVSVWIFTPLSPWFWSGYLVIFCRFLLSSFFVEVVCNVVSSVGVVGCWIFLSHCSRCLGKKACFVFLVQSQCGVTFVDGGIFHTIWELHSFSQVLVILAFFISWFKWCQFSYIVTTSLMTRSFLV